MRTLYTLASATLLAVATLNEPAFTQVPAPPVPGAPLPASRSAATYDPHQFPAERGDVQQFTLTSRGDIDGLILKDGTEVKTPPDLSTQIAYILKPGDHVTVYGLKAAALPLVRAVAITNNATQQTVADADVAMDGPRPAPPPGSPGSPRRGVPGPLPPDARAAANEVSGRVRMPLHNPQGEVDGALLDNGTLLRLPPREAEQFASLLQPRQTVIAQGLSVANSLGTVLEVQLLGASREQLRPIGPPAPPGPTARPGQPSAPGPLAPPVPPSPSPSPPPPPAA